MSKNYYLPYLQICIISILFASCSQVEPELIPGAEGEWRHAGGDHSSAKYAALDQIDSSNFSELQLAWSWQSADLRLPEGVGYGTADYRAVPYPTPSGKRRSADCQLHTSCNSEKLLESI